MALIVQKFGGTSVSTPERIRSVAHRIAHAYSEGHKLVVVVSAMGQTTDELIDLANQVSENPPHREMDMLLTAGERISMALLSMALSDLQISARSLTGSQSGIITDQSHRRARIQRILGDRIRSALVQRTVVIVAGFQGVSETKEVTTLGRGGSDTSAVALAASLQADVCEIYTDVDGIYSADPHLVPKAKFWKQIPHDLMVEMSNRGAGVLNSRSVELAKKYDVILRVRNSLNESEGTLVVSRDNPVNSSGHLIGMEEFSITGVTCDSTKILLSVQLSRPTVLGAMWERASQCHLSVVAPVFSNGEVRFFSDRDGEGEWRKNLDELAYQGFVKEYQIDTGTVPLSVVGNRFSQDGSALHQVIDVLAAQHILVTVGSASALAITVGIPMSRADEGVKVLHQEFLEDKS